MVGPDQLGWLYRIEHADIETYTQVVSRRKGTSGGYVQNGTAARRHDTHDPPLTACDELRTSPNAAIS
jgi:hypothetical protein